MKKLGLIIGTLAVAGSFALSGTQAQASSYHNGIPTAVRGNWRTSVIGGNYYVFKFGKQLIENHVVVKSHGKWHARTESINPINTLNGYLRYRKIDAHSYYLLHKKGLGYVKGANGAKVVKKSSKKLAIKYHYAGTGWSSYQTLYK